MKNTFRFTQEHKKWIINNSKNFIDNDSFRIEFNKKFNLNITKNSFQTIKSRLGAKNPKYFTQEQDDFIKEMFEQGKLYDEIINSFNKKFNSNKTVATLASHISKKLHIDKNNYVQRQRCSKQCPVGTIRERNNGQTTRLLIKIKLIPQELFGKVSQYSAEYWIPYSKFVYENYYNCKLSKNEFVYHLDGDSLNNNIDNLAVGVGASGIAYGKVFKNIKVSSKEKERTAKSLKVALITSCVEHQISKLMKREEKYGN